MALSDDGRLLYALSSADQTLHEFRIESDGGLTPIGTLSGVAQTTGGLAVQ